MADDVGLFLAQYKDTAGEGAVLELRLRLLADKVPALNYDVDDKFHEIETKVIEHFDASLDQTERDTLTRCGQLRNKIMHADFSKVREHLHGLGRRAFRVEFERSTSLV